MNEHSAIMVEAATVIADKAVDIMDDGVDMMNNLNGQNMEDVINDLISTLKNDLDNMMLPKNTSVPGDAPHIKRMGMNLQVRHFFLTLSNFGNSHVFKVTVCFLGYKAIFAKKI